MLKTPARILPQICRQHCTFNRQGGSWSTGFTPAFCELTLLKIPGNAEDLVRINKVRVADLVPVVLVYQGPHKVIILNLCVLGYPPQAFVLFNSVWILLSINLLKYQIKSTETWFLAACASVFQPPRSRLLAASS